MQTRGIWGGGGEQRTLCNHRDIQWTPLQRRVKYNHTNTLILPHTLGDSSTFALEVAKENTTIRHAPSFPIMPISAY